MALRWPLLLVLAVAAVAVATYFVVRRTGRGWQGELPLLARSFRLTDLPEYQRAIRWHQRVAIVALVTSMVAVAALIGVTTRPAWTYEPRKDTGDTPYVDVMLCFGEYFAMYDSQRMGLIPLLDALRDKVNRFGNQRIGMTNKFYRSFPVTADHQWVADRLDAIIGVARESESASNRAYRVNAEAYERSSYSAGAAPSPVETLAMCTMGLPSVGDDNGRARMILYVGGIEDSEDPGAIKMYSRPPARVYPRTTLDKAVKSARIQIDAIVPDPRGRKPIGFVEQLIKDTGGTQIRYTPLGYRDQKKPNQHHVDAMKAELGAAVDKILSNPPPSALDQTRIQAARPFQWDVPDVLLQIALVTAVVLGAARLVMRL